MGLRRLLRRASLVLAPCGRDQVGVGAGPSGVRGPIAALTAPLDGIAMACHGWPWHATACRGTVVGFGVGMAVYVGY